MLGICLSSHRQGSGKDFPGMLGWEVLEGDLIPVQFCGAALEPRHEC